MELGSWPVFDGEENFFEEVGVVGDGCQILYWYFGIETPQDWSTRDIAFHHQKSPVGKKYVSVEGFECSPGLVTVRVFPERHICEMDVSEQFASQGLRSMISVEIYAVALFIWQINPFVIR